MNYKRLYRSSRVWVACDLKLRAAVLGPFLAAYLPIPALFSSVYLLYFKINRIPITQHHTNFVYSRSAIISVIALLLTNQLPITLCCTPTSAKSVIGC